MPTWTNKTREISEGGEEKILTPDGYSILLGSSEDQELIYQEPYSLWSLKAKD